MTAARETIAELLDEERTLVFIEGCMHSHTSQALTAYRADILSIVHQGGDEEDISKLDLNQYNK